MAAQCSKLIRLQSCSYLLCLIVTGCASLASPTPRPVTAQSGDADTGLQGDAGTEASTALLVQSRAQRASGSYAEASATVERALRIKPNDPLLWIELGEIKLAEGDLEQAATMARKALTLTGGDRSIESRAYRLINR